MSAGAKKISVLGTSLGLPGKLPLSLGIRAGDYIFTAGQVPYDDKGQVVEGGIEQQTCIALERIKAILEEAGSSMEDIVKTTVYLQDTRDFERFNNAYGKFFGEKPPARSTVRVDLIFDFKVEIEAIAYAPQS